MPLLSQKIKTKWGYLKEFRKAYLEIKQQQKVNFYKRHAVKRVPPLSPKTYVWIDAGCNIQEGQIDHDCNQPRPYDVVTARGNFRRNRRDIIPVPSNSFQ